MPSEHSEVEKQQTDGSYPETLGGKSRWLQLMIQMWLFKKGFGPIVNALSSLPNSRKREDYSSQTRLCLLITQISNALWPNLAKLSIFYKLAIPGYWVNFQRIMWGRFSPNCYVKIQIKVSQLFSYEMIQVNNFEKVPFVQHFIDKYNSSTVMWNFRSNSLITWY